MLCWSFSLLVLPTILQAAVVRQARTAPAGHEYIPPGPDDGGILQPAGFIPRNGKNITAAAVAAGLKEGLNVGLDFGLVVGQGATLSNPDPLLNTFNMDQLREHNFPIEHDVSLSRQDYYQGDNLHFNQSVFNEVLSYYNGMTHTSLPVAAHALWGRVHTQRAINGNMELYGFRHLVLSLVETSLYMSVMGNPITGDAPIEYVRIFFEQERLPYEEGWTASPVETDFATLAVMANEVIGADPGDFGADLPNLDVDTIKDVFQLNGDVAGTIINATCALDGKC